jgi:hypothetical protein
LLRLRKEGLPWEKIATQIGKPTSTCCRRYDKLIRESVKQNWSEELDVAMKRAYHKKRSDFWTAVASEMGFEEDWKIIEARIFEIGLKRMK